MSEEKEQSKRFRGLLLPVLVIICIVAVSASIIFFAKYRKAQDTGQAQQKKLIAKIAEAIELPQSDPTVVTVTDKEKLTNKALASRVHNQDMLLIYGPAKRIIIYRPSSEKVIDMLSFEAQNGVPAGTDTKSGN